MLFRLLLLLLLDPACTPSTVLPVCAPLLAAFLDFAAIEFAGEVAALLLLLLVLASAGTAAAVPSAYAELSFPSHPLLLLGSAAAGLLAMICLPLLAVTLLVTLCAA
jgi:hypothetical protein